MGSHKMRFLGWQMRLTALASTCLLTLLFHPAALAADRALLVGVENYRQARVPPTPGCVKDALDTAEFIKRNHNFAAADIRVLIDAQATSDNIVRQFREWLIEGTKPGDRVFFLYAGHGSQLPDDNGDEADDGMDETLAPYDVNPSTGEGEIRDDIFDQLIAQLSGRRAVLLFDSCHSGTISRDLSAPAVRKVPGLGRFPAGGGVRYLPAPEQFRQLEGPASRDIGGGGYVVHDGGRDLKTNYFVSQESVGMLSGVIIISAASPTQLAHPLEVNGQYRGALSYAFAEAQRGGGESLRRVRSGITEYIERMQKLGKLGGSQVPQFEILSTVPLDDQPLFGTWEEAPAVALANPLSAMRVGVETAEGKHAYRIGEDVSYKVTSDTPGYLYLLVFSPQNVATCIFPNKLDTNNRITAGTHTVPRGDYSFPVMEPVGRDVVVALVSKYPLRISETGEYVGDEVFKIYSWEEVFTRLSLKKLQAAIVGRAIGAKKNTAPLTDADWQSATLVLETRK
jgi:Caspase domain/Domain of unknown function (DUF4384)